VDGQNHVQEREIKIGIEGANRIQVLSGLNEGDRVIVGNGGEYHPGQRVEPKLSTMAEETSSSDQGAQ
jgi:multidrug efflux pump subunit AcrA (membrane-fusion protein)